MDGLFTAGPGGPRLGDLLFWIGTPLIFFGALGLGLLRSLGVSILRRRFIVRHGFAPCLDDGAGVQARLRRLPRDPQFEDAILRPMHAGIGATTVEVFTRHRRGAAALRRDAHSLLLRLPGQDFPPCMLCLRPPEDAAGSPMKRLQSAAFALSGDHPDDLVPLASHRLLRDAGLLSAWGPRGAQLLDLIDPLLLEELLGLGRHGVRIVRCCGEDCALEIPVGFDGDLEDLWAPMQRIVRLCASGRRAKRAS